MAGSAEPIQYFVFHLVNFPSLYQATHIQTISNSKANTIKMTTPYEKALHQVDQAHSEDPRRIPYPNSSQPISLQQQQDEIQETQNETIPYELHYATKMTQYLDKRQPNASELLRLAIRAQHLRRWEVPRDSYPMTKIGYHSWRNHLAKRQAELVVEICVKSGYTQDEAERVGALVRKEGLKRNPGEESETQVLEDVACLVFLDDQFEDFEKGIKDEEKVITILRKTWVKMSSKGHEMAIELSEEMSERARGLVQKALGG